MMGQLSDFRKKNEKFFKLHDGESADVVFKGFDITKSTFDPEKEVVAYQLITEYGPKTWSTSAGMVADFFDRVKPNERVHITRIGEGTKTTYQLASLEKN